MPYFNETWEPQKKTKLSSKFGINMDWRNEAKYTLSYKLIY